VPSSRTWAGEANCGFGFTAPLGSVPPQATSAGPGSGCTVPVCAPGSPVGPVGPVSPVSPVAPVAPEAPVAAGGSSSPVVNRRKTPSEPRSAMTSATAMVIV
jgi:hypothetical protein